MTPLAFKLWRVARGFNQTAVARMFDVTQQAVSLWETKAVPDWVSDEIEPEESDPDADRGDWEFHRDHDQ